MTAESHPTTPPRASDSDPDPGAAAPRRLSEAEVQSLKAIIHDVKGPGAAETNHWELETMAPLNAASIAAIARLKAYEPPVFPIWDRLPASRRAAVLILLYADRRGDLRVVLTMRAANLRSFSGHAAFPGGKADSVEETPYQVARREAWEEIGLPMDDTKIPAPFKVEFLCHLPHNLARTALVVRPCVALLHTPPTTTLSTDPSGGASPSVESMIPRLDPGEVAAVFSAPFANFLAPTDLDGAGAPPGHWYDGRWISWNDHPWRVHNFYVPVTNQRVAKPPPAVRKGEEGELADKLEGDVKVETEGETAAEAGRYKVWGMTAKILVDAAIVAYGQRPGFEHNDKAGDEGLIEICEKRGDFFDKAKVRAGQNGTEGKGDGGEPAKM